MTKAIFRKRIYIITMLLSASFALAIIILIKKTPPEPIKTLRTEISRTEISRLDTIETPAPAIFMLADNYSYRQDDPAWGASRIGMTSDSLESYGCTIASVAVAASNLLKTEISPDEMNTLLGDANGFTNRGWLIWKHVGTATDGKLRAALDNRPSHNAIGQCMTSGGYPIIKIKLGGRIIHWVVIVGKSDNDYLIRDPLVGGANDDPILLSSRSEYIYASRCITLTAE